MLRPAVLLDAELSAGDVLERLALNGYWLDANHPAVTRRLASLVPGGDRSAADLLRMLARDPRAGGAAIRRQWGANILWYARELVEVLARCVAVNPDVALIDALDLHESGSQPVIDAASTAPLGTGVVMLRGSPVAVSFVIAAPAAPLAAPPAPDALTNRGDARHDALRTATRSTGTGGVTAERAPGAAPLWPRIDAPSWTPAAVPFDVVVGFGRERQAQVAGAPVVLRAAAGAGTVDVTIELSAAEGIESLDGAEGWIRTLRVPLADPASVHATFRLVGAEPTNRERAWLTLLEVRYVVEGTVCGTASRPIVVQPSGAGAPQQRPLGTPWMSGETSASPVVLAPDAEAPDLTLEIAEPDANDAAGQYVCRLCSPHLIATGRGPFRIRLGHDARTYARQIVDEVRTYARSELLDSCLEAIGRRVGGRLPPQFYTALHEVAARVAPQPPAVMIVSREPYVPWELAWVEPPLDDSRPNYLGAQALVGRWLRDDTDDGSGEAVAGSLLRRPETHPRARLDVHRLAVVAAWYKAASGLRRLPKAEEEAKALVARHHGLALAASAQTMRQLLTAKLYDGAEPVGPVGAVHFAGHGDFDPALPDGTALYLIDGIPLRSSVFASARYGGERQPLLFLNACMLGIGGEVLGDMGGFPGNSLRGGFGGVLGALWEVDDAVAHDIAVEFWRRALPDPPGRGEPVAAILRDLRARYVPDALPAPATYLSYVYYGHPRLTLAHAARDVEHGAGGARQGARAAS